MRPDTPIRRLLVRRDGGGYLLAHDNPNRTRFRATPYGVRRLLADYGAEFSRRTASGWHYYTIPEVSIPEAEPRRCLAHDCDEFLPAGAPVNRRFCCAACQARNSRHRKPVIRSRPPSPMCRADDCGEFVPDGASPLRRYCREACRLRMSSKRRAHRRAQARK